MEFKLPESLLGRIAVGIGLIIAVMFGIIIISKIFQILFVVAGIALLGYGVYYYLTRE
jgi:hypothetical protein